MTYKAQDKSNDRLNQRLMGQFHHLLNDIPPKEVHLSGRLYTWSNERAHPRIDRAFVSNEWDDIFAHSDLQALSTICSDHAPLLLQTDVEHQRKKRFIFRSFWTRCDGFLEVVGRAWHCPLYWLFRSTTRFLKSWSNRFVGNVRMQLTMAKEVVARLEATGNYRPLAPHEDALRKELKLKALGLSSLQHTIARQEARVLWLREGDTPTKFFHAQPNARRRRNFIHSLDHDGSTVVAEDAKAEVATKFFEQVLATLATRTRRIKLDRLDLLHPDLAGITDRFTEDEAWSVIKALPPHKAPSPDGFTTCFLQAAWPVIRHGMS
jgi:hypothetical protein